MAVRFGAMFVVQGGTQMGKVRGGLGRVVAKGVGSYNDAADHRKERAHCRRCAAASGTPKDARTRGEGSE